MPSDDSSVDIERLLDEFYGPPASHAQLGSFDQVVSVPPPYDRLLDHHDHMTVTVESHYGQKVGVNVHRHAKRGDWYSREITLVTGGTGQIVQYGIVRLNVSALGHEVWAQIQSRRIPLGRVLIEHDVMREVQLCSLWRVLAGPSLASLLHLKIGDELFGRTALIFCHNSPAIELLEIVAPVPAGPQVVPN
jgi:chorismate-pyruvate lyase